MDDTAESISSKDADVVLSSGVGECFQGCGLTQGPVRPVRIEVVYVFGDGLLQLALVEDERAVQQFPS
jgi:hypothetical protein